MSGNSLSPSGPPIKNARAFADQFLAQFAARAAIEGSGLGPKWVAGGMAWTDLMLGRDHSVLWKTAAAWANAPNAASLHHNWYTIDLLAVQPPFAGQVQYWDTRATLLIEHENGADIETELWKLVHWRAPLKVLVFYRQNGDDQWLQRKLAFADKIISNPIEQKEEYLLLVGCIENGCVQWREHAWPGNGLDAIVRETSVQISV